MAAQFTDCDVTVFPFTRPLSFQLTNPANGKVIHAGVLDFTSPEAKVAYAPTWMMDFLGVSDGQAVELQAVNLPKGRFCQLQPLSPSWLDVSFESRQSVLEFELRQYQTLTEGAVVHIHHEGSTHDFLITECRPGKGISIVDTDIETDIIEPAESTKDPQAQMVSLVIGHEVAATAAAGQYCRLKLVPLPEQTMPPQCAVYLSATKGDPDLYVGRDRSTAQNSYLLCNQEEGDKMLFLNATTVDGWDTLQQGIYLGTSTEGQMQSTDAAGRSFSELIGTDDSTIHLPCFYAWAYLFGYDHVGVCGLLEDVAFTVKFCKLTEAEATAAVVASSIPSPGLTTAVALSSSQVGSWIVLMHIENSKSNFGWAAHVFCAI